MTETRTRKIFAFLLTFALVLTQFTFLSTTVFAAEEKDEIALAQEYLSQFDDHQIITTTQLNAVIAILNGEEIPQFAPLAALDLTQQMVVQSFLTGSAMMKEHQFAGGPANDPYYNYNKMAEAAGFFENWDYKPEELLEIIELSDMIEYVGPPLQALRNAVTAENPEPYFVNGMAVPIFPYGNSDTATYNDTTGEGIARFCVYVESDLDTDGDGKLDLVKALVQLPRASVDKGMKVSTIYEARPYIAGTGSQNVPAAERTAGDNWLAENGGEFDHNDLYKTAPARTPAGITDTKTMAATANYNDWYYRYGVEQLYEDLNWYDYYLVRGFAVVESAGIGTMGSEGYASCGADIEINAFKCVIEWMTGDRIAYTDKTSNIEIKADWSNGNIGMTGRSYSGTTQFGLSTTGVKGLKTIVPVAGIASWYEYTNGQGRLGSTAYSTGLAFYVNSRYATSSNGGDMADWASIRDRYMGYSQQMRLDETALNGNYGDHWARRDYTQENWFRDWGPSKMQVPMLIVHGLNDDNVRAKQSVLMYQAAQKADVPVKMIWHQGHHMTPTYPASTYEMYCGTYNINGNEVDLMYDDILNLWFSHYLYGVDNDVMDILPNVMVQSNDIATNGNGSNGWVGYDSWEPENIAVLSNNHRVAATTRSPFSAAIFEEPEDYSEEYPIPDGDSAAGGNESEASNFFAPVTSIAAAAATDDFTTINSANGSSSWQNFLTAPTAGSSLYVAEIPQDITVKGVVAVNIRAALASVGANLTDNLGMHVKLVEVAKAGTTLRYYGGTAVGSTIGTTTIMSRGAWMGGGATNYNLVRFNQATTGTYREIAKGWIDLCNPEAKYDSYTAANHIVPADNIGVYNDYTVYLQPAVHTLKAGNKLALIITTGNTSAASYTGNNAYSFTIDNSATYAEVPLASATEEVYGLNLTTNAHLVKKGDYFTMNTAFTSAVSSNTATLEYTFDADKFEYAGFTGADGVTVVATEISDGKAKITVMKTSYDIRNFGDIMLRAKTDAELANGYETVSVKATYVEKAPNGDKTIKELTDYESFLTYLMPEYFTLIDLSNIIDWINIGKDNAEWNSIYTYWDFNNDGVIGIYDIAFIAQRI